jgi:hypothetical protein
MAQLGALSQSWIAAEASLPLGRQISGMWQVDGLWVSLQPRSLGPGAAQGAARDVTATGTASSRL